MDTVTIPTVGSHPLIRLSTQLLTGNKPNEQC